MTLRKLLENINKLCLLKGALDSPIFNADGAEVADFEVLTKPDGTVSGVRLLPDPEVQMRQANLDILALSTRMPAALFQKFTTLLMCSDPWPVEWPVYNDNQTSIKAWADEEARRHGFDNWVEAYHKL